MVDFNGNIKQFKRNTPDTAKIPKGEEKLSAFQAREGKKHFCSTCGTPLFNLNNKYPGVCLIYLGTLEDSRNLTPMINIWCESKLGWIDEITAIKSTDHGVERKQSEH